MNQSFRLTFSAILVALSTLCLMSTALVSTLEYAMPLLGGIILLPILVEFGAKWALLSYVCVSLLGFLLPHNPQALVLFWCLFGYYPVLKAVLEKSKYAVVRWVLKVGSFLLALLVSGLLLFYLFGLRELLQDFTTVWVGLAFLLAGCLVFVVYDRVLSMAAGQYLLKFRRHFSKFLR